MWREVKDGSARKAGPTSKTRSKPGGHRHLLIKLRRLGQVGFGLEIRQLEQLGPAFGG